MPLNKRALELQPDPQSVHHARQWVADILDGLSRSDLVDAAQLGVSELVTNAILHAVPPISVRVRGTRDHPRVEVHDHSRHPPRLTADMTDGDNLLSTIGRGLGIVALYSSSWGSEVGPEGKTVWFEPSPDHEALHEPSGDIYNFAQYVEHRTTQAPPPDRLITVRLLDMPAQVFAVGRMRYAELRRELRLLALSHGDDYPLARELADLFVQVEQERQQSSGLEALDRAIQEGRARVDLEYWVPASAPATMTRLREKLEEADQFCRDQKLLALAASPQQAALRRWYLGEFGRQAAGEQPQPWTGSFAVEDSAVLT